MTSISTSRIGYIKIINGRQILEDVQCVVIHVFLTKPIISVDKYAQLVHFMTFEKCRGAMLPKR